MDPTEHLLMDPTEHLDLNFKFDSNLKLVP